jgi:hypothetical protein
VLPGSLQLTTACTKASCVLPTAGWPARAAGASWSGRDGKGGAETTPGHVGGIQDVGREGSDLLDANHPTAWIDSLSLVPVTRQQPEVPSKVP